MSRPNVVASKGSAGTSIYSEIGAMPVIATSSNSMTLDCAALERSVAVPGGLPIIPCIAV
jgi:hypothetical protein